MTNLCSYAGPVLAAVLVTWSELAGYAPATARPLALICAVVYLPLLSWQTAKHGTSAIDKGFGAYFVLFAVAFWLPVAGLAGFAAKYAVALIYLALLGAVAVPLILGMRPFTEYFARKNAPPEVWQTDIFKTINRRMTAVWALLFIIAIFLAAAPSALGLRNPPMRITMEGVLPTVLMLLVGRPFNKWYPQHYQSKIGLV